MAAAGGNRHHEPDQASGENTKGGAGAVGRVLERPCQKMQETDDTRERSDWGAHPSLFPSQWFLPPSPSPSGSSPSSSWSCSSSQGFSIGHMAVSARSLSTQRSMPELSWPR